MQHHACGCTLGGPGCEQGHKLFAQAEHTLSTIQIPSWEGGPPWINYHLARLVYLDHLNGLQEGDVKVRQERGNWAAYRRSCGQWIVWLEGEEQQLLARLHLGGYRKSGPRLTNSPIARSLGYYRKQESRAAPGETPASASLTEPGARDGMAVSEQAVLPTASQINPPTGLDLKTQVTLLIALLVGEFPRPLTAVDRLWVQQRATSLLMAHGMAIGLQDERAIVELIDGAVQQKGHLPLLF